MRLIDADAMTSKIKKQYCEDCDRRKGENNGKRYMVYEIGDAPCRACSIDDIYADLDDAPTIQPEPHWIPVTERPPETTGEYLVTKREMYTHRLIIDIAMYFVNDGWHKADPVIAWIPKPEPYKG